MDIKTLLREFKTQSEIARAFNVSRQAVAKWVAAGELPALRVYQAAAVMALRKGKRQK